MAPESNDKLYKCNENVKKTNITNLNTDVDKTKMSQVIQADNGTVDTRNARRNTQIVGSKTSKDTSYRTTGETLPEPMSPSSSSSTSQGTGTANDTTFEPTVEMMVNDFDDEQTLNEEEALAALESHDPEDEINTLKEEGDMPLEDLLAKYQGLVSPLPCISETVRKKVKKTSKIRSKNVCIEANKSNATEDYQYGEKHLEHIDSSANSDIIVIESGDEKEISNGKHAEDYCRSDNQSPVKQTTQNSEDANGTAHVTPVKAWRTHLLNLHPEVGYNNRLNNTAVIVDGKDISLEVLYGMADDEEDAMEDDDEFKKKVMIGPSYQAIIPIGLSQYGDILPYENEDKLIWEPSQVSEHEVEEYLLKVRDIKPSLAEENPAIVNDELSTNNVTTTVIFDKQRVKNFDNEIIKDSQMSTPSTPSTVDFEVNGVVKDNEQALHLLVQCGYDFKEALRRKRLNALPLNDSMSLWSEEECQKFEEGIQKYGKDFWKIRQNQVRTRTMRELVQFYYLWKKCERRDHNFANADTVDHMDIYLNEDNDYSSNGNTLTSLGSPLMTSITSQTRRNSSSPQKNVSIMIGANHKRKSNNSNCSTSMEQLSDLNANGSIHLS